MGGAAEVETARSVSDDFGLLDKMITLPALQYGVDFVNCNTGEARLTRESVVPGAGRGDYRYLVLRLECGGPTGR